MKRRSPATVSVSTPTAPPAPTRTCGATLSRGRTCAQPTYGGDSVCFYHSKTEVGLVQADDPLVHHPLRRPTGGR